MQNIVSKLILIVAFLGLCAWSLIPPSQTIRLGKDLRGGVSLIYRVSIPEGADRDAVLAQTIEVLKDRVNPKGVFDISFQPLGLDRIEIVMPLPNQNVQSLNREYQDKLTNLLAEVQIVASDLDHALQAEQAPQQFCGTDTNSERCRKITDLQQAFVTMRDARQVLVDAQAAGEDVATLAVKEAAVADAEIEYERLHFDVLQLSLDRSRMVRVLGLPTDEQKVRDPVTGEIRLDPVTGDEIKRPSARTEALAALKAEFSDVAAEVDETVIAHDRYQKNRSGLDDPEDLMRLLRGAGVLEFHITVDASNPQGVNIEDVRRQLKEVGPDNLDTTSVKWLAINELKQWYETPEQLAALEADPRAYFASPPRSFVVDFFDGQYFMLLYNLPAKRMTHDRDEGHWSITSTYRSIDNLGRPAVAFTLDTAGGTRMAKLTGSHVGEPMAIVLDDEVFSAPTLQSQISSNGVITGSFSQDEISYLIRVLAAGSLEARLSSDPIATNILGPTLGADNLTRGRRAFIIAIVVVAIFMLGYYFFAGLVADIALFANGLIIFGVMAMIDGTFTLPGLAGIVLTVGMAVDANVLIYERIREEIFAGEKDIRTAIRVGYARALSTIVDANVTNLIICFVLFYTATAEVKGFALTLTIGICATLFTALFVTRVIYTLYTDLFGAKSLNMLPIAVPAVHRALEPNIAWISLRKVFWTVSSIVVVASVVMVVTRGVDMIDTELRGGVTATMLTRSIDADEDGRPDEVGGKVQRIWLTQSEVEDTLRQIGTSVAPAAAGSPEAIHKQKILRELANVAVTTAGETRTTDAGVEAQSFQVKVANPKGLEDEEAITNVIVEAIVGAFGDRLEVSPALEFEGAGEANAAEHVFAIEDQDLGRVIGVPSLTTDIKDFRGGAAIVVRDIHPPETLANLSNRIERMRNQPDFKDTVGRKTRVVGVEPVDRSRPDGPYRSAAVLVYEPNLSILRVESDVWFSQLAQPEWTLVSAAFQRRSSLEQVSSFSSAVARTLSAQAIVAGVLSLLGILIYVWVRFGSLRYSFAAIVALVHDVSIALGLLAFSAFLAGTAFGRMLGVEAFRIDLGVVAALLTIVGYSLNDTIVILDRIRENRGKRPLPTEEIVNRSINQTVSRTLLTSFTTLVAVMIMYTQGGSGIRPFTFTLLIGIVVGTYSSVAIAAPLVFRKGTRIDEDEAAGEALTSTSSPGGSLTSEEATPATA